MKVNTFVTRAAVLAVVGRKVGAIDVDFTSQASVKSAAGTLAYDMMTYYTGNISGPYNIPGLLPEPPSGYYWWEAGAMWGTMINYWYTTGDTSYNDVVSQGMLFQVGPNQDYMPPNQSKSLGNDDQGFWGMSAMMAAEYNFPDPPADQPQWLALAQAVFNTQAAVWDPTSCGGGLRWQKFTFNNGYNYKNAISNGCFFNLGARLAKYTGNDTYAQWAEETYDWVSRIGLIDDKYYIYDGSDDTLNCSQVNHIQYSYNPGVWLLGAANMYNYTNGSAIWKERVNGLLTGALQVFTDATTGVMVEVSCETQTPPTCDTDMLSFKAYLSRWMAASTKMAPFIYDTVSAALMKSAVAAAAQCTGGSSGRECGLKWTENGKQAVWDGTTGVGQEMAALEVVMSTIVNTVKAPVTNATGGTSIGNSNAGTGSGSTSASGISEDTKPITTGSRAGAGLLTALVLVCGIGGMTWMSMD